MEIQYKYLAGILLPAFVWAVMYVSRKDLRKPMIWSGIAYMALLTAGFAGLYLLIIFGFVSEPRTITPGYWEPVTLFNLGMLTNGYAIEDLLFMFFAGGIGVACYDFFLKRKNPLGYPSPLKFKYAPVLAGLAVAGGIVFFSPFNLIYALIWFGFSGAFVLWLQRKDLFVHSILSGLIFLGIYSVLFLIFLAIFPEFVKANYHLENAGGILFFGIPLEEFFYALSFGMLWDLYMNMSIKSLKKTSFLSLSTCPGHVEFLLKTCYN